MSPSARRQGIEALVPGVIAGFAMALLVRPSLGPLAGYDAAVLVYVTRVWLTIWPLDADGTAAIAQREDPDSATADVVLLAAAVASLGAVAVAIAESHSSHGTDRSVEIALGVVSVVLSWLVVHTIFTLKYARLYYRDGARTQARAIEFEHRVRPPYSDFAYLALTIGMTFQVSDTDLQSVEMRRLALRHALLSYLFGAVILAATINLVAGLAT